jgi:Tfp pilus assembly protein PilF
MTSTDPGARVDELKARWEADPSSRVFVQLAEEYRRQGQTDDAIAVLEKGLADQPNYVSALVALGRCRLDAGDASGAVEILSRVTEQDASHPLAGKLLVEAHLQTGELDEAAKRLDLYRMMADSDPEIEELEQRLRKAREGESEAIDTPGGGTRESAAGESKPQEHEPREPEVEEVSGLEDLELSFEDPGSQVVPTGQVGGPDDVFDLGPSESAPPEGGPFDLSETPAVSAQPASEGPVAPPDEPFQLAPPATGDGAGDRPGASETGAGEPFGDLFGEADLERLSAVPAEGIFDLSASAPPPAPDPSGPAAAARVEAEDEESAKAVVSEPVFEAISEAVSEAVREDGSGRTAPRAEGEDREEATVTLGQLYMMQGHRDEAARIFRSVLERDPHNEISRKALAELDLDKVELPEPAGVEPVDVVAASPRSKAPSGPIRPPAAGVTERKIAMLEDYLQRLRRVGGS